MTTVMVMAATSALFCTSSVGSNSTTSSLSPLVGSNSTTSSLSPLVGSNSTTSSLSPLVGSNSTTSSLSPLVSHRKALPSRFSKWPPQLGPSHFSQWNGLKHLGISISPKSLKLERRRRCKGMVVHASLFGVGAPEALVIGVVALLVFGPKGLAEVARNLGKTLRTFQPTIRELQEVSKEFKSTLEREIGLDELPNSTQNKSITDSPYLSKSPPTPSPVPSVEETGSKADSSSTQSVNEAYTGEEYLKITEEQLKASASEQQAQTASPGETESGSQNQHEAPLEETAAAAVPPSPKPESET